MPFFTSTNTSCVFLDTVICASVPGSKTGAVLVNRTLLSFAIVYYYILILLGQA